MKLYTVFSGRCFWRQLFANGALEIKLHQHGSGRKFVSTSLEAEAEAKAKEEAEENAILDF